MQPFVRVCEVFSVVPEQPDEAGLLRREMLAFDVKAELGDRLRGILSSFIGKPCDKATLRNLHSATQNVLRDFLREKAPSLYNHAAQVEVSIDPEDSSMLRISLPLEVREWLDSQR